MMRISVLALSLSLFILVKGDQEEKIHKRIIKGRPLTGFVPRTPLEAQEKAKTSSSVKYGWFQQHLDHFNQANDKMWWQLYYTNDEYYNYQQGGPIFLYISGEAPIDAGWMTYGDWYKNARLNNAYMVQLEHRYYGHSHPTPNMTTANMKWLNSDQALADLAYFIGSFQMNNNMTNSKVVVFGGSYAGNMAAWFRLKYSGMSVGSIASSAPVYAEADFYQYLEVVTKSLEYISPGCSNYAKSIFKDIQTLLLLNRGHVLTNLFNLCSDINISQIMDVSTFYEYLIGTFMGYVQYASMDKDNEVALLCQALGDSSNGASPMFRYAKYLNPSGKKNPNTCYGYSYSNEVYWLNQTDWKSYAATSGTRAWIYQTCTEFGYYQTTDSDNQVFGKHMSLSYSEALCKDLFNINSNQINNAIIQTNNDFGATNLTATNVVLPNGSVDPWHALGILETRLNHPSGQTTQFYEGGSHCYDMLPSQPSDSQALLQVRSFIQQQIGQWVNQ